MWAALHGDFGISYRLAQPVGQPDRRAAAGDAGAGDHRHRCWRSRSACRWASIPASTATTLLSRAVHGRQPGRRLAADVPDRHPADPGVQRCAGLAAELRARRRWCISAWWTTGFADAVAAPKALILPAITLGLFQMTLIMRLVRAEMLEVLRTDYIKFARARGLTSRAINFGHALKNTLVPVITIIGLQFGGIVAFSIDHRDGVPVARHGAACSCSPCRSPISR